jgi:ParB family chromosome partitioning protein
MAPRPGLGKGLGALIPPELMDNGGGNGPGAELIDIPISALEPNPHQPRVHFDEETLTDLAASIAELGVLQPVLVRRVGEGRYQLIAGERRWRAAKRAGLAIIPAIVRLTDDMASMEQALVENLHRQDLTPLEEAAAYQQLIEDFGLTHEALASRVGKSRPSISNALRLLALPAAVQSLIADGRLSAGHAKALLGTPDRAYQEHLARRTVDEGWTVRAVEDAVRQRQGGSTPPTTGSPEDAEPGPAPAPVTRLRPPGLLELEELLSDHLSTRVTVTMGTSRGKVVVEFADLEDLERLYRAMTEVPLDTA